MTEKERKTHIQNRLKAHYDYIESLGYEIVGVFLQGSQNYDLDIYDEDYTSDVDTKCLVIPKLDALIKGTPMVSKKYDFEGEQIDVKDVRVMMEMWKKQNQAYLEILFTKYKIINPKYKFYINAILEMKDEISKMNPPQLARCISGMSKEKVCALEHEYPATAEKIKRFGYDPKQLVSIIRLTHLIENIFIEGQSFDVAMLYTDDELKKYMIDIKKGTVEVKEARRLADIYDEKTYSIKTNVVEQYGKDAFNSEVYEKLEGIIYELVKFGIISGVVDMQRDAFKELCGMMVPSDFDDATLKVIEGLSVEHKENFLDYYK